MSRDAHLRPLQRCPAASRLIFCEVGLADTVFPTSVRLPMRLRKLLRQEARKQGRSFVRHIEWILTRHLEAQGIEVELKPKKKETGESGG